MPSSLQHYLERRRYFASFDRPETAAFKCKLHRGELRRNPRMYRSCRHSTSVEQLNRYSLHGSHFDCRRIHMAHDKLASRLLWCLGLRTCAGNPSPARLLLKWAWQCGLIGMQLPFLKTRAHIKADSVIQKSSADERNSLRNLSVERSRQLVPTSYFR